MIRIGIDLGGTKIEIIALSAKGDVILRNRKPTPIGDYQATLNTIKSLVDDVENAQGCTSTVGLGAPGAISRHDGTLKNANSVWLNGQPLVQDLERLLKRTIKIANDADCFALSESVDGNAVGYKVVFGIILGTGVGAGIVVNGKLLNGPNAIAGEWGHNPLPWLTAKEYPGPSCYCGQLGCIETFISGPALAATHRTRTGLELSAEVIATRALHGDQECDKSLRYYEQRLARALAHVINILDPDVIVVGGGLSNCQRLYQSVPDIWRKFVFSDHVSTELVPPKHGDSSGVRGAAWLWDEIAVDHPAGDSS